GNPRNHNPTSGNNHRTHACELSLYLHCYWSFFFHPFLVPHSRTSNSYRCSPTSCLLSSFSLPLSAVAPFSLSLLRWSSSRLFQSLPPPSWRRYEVPFAARRSSQAPAAGPSGPPSGTT